MNDTNNLKGAEAVLKFSVFNDLKNGSGRKPSTLVLDKTPTIFQIFERMSIKPKLLSLGALRSNDISCLVKDRIPKKYREKKLDNMLRKSRTKKEAKILEKASKSGIPCPRLLEVSEFTITMSIIKGQNAEANEKNVKEAGKILEQLHSLNIIHGDYTFANLM
ncbi:MAG: hypothetical protein PHU63_03940, partial [Candidatus ainarchaeum sp.]|nr:hypothetical protein [Candidatus ainarchaeum sp.]